jgi:hypothetical protein
MSGTQKEKGFTTKTGRPRRKKEGKKCKKKASPP